jgi:hypothetical protein
MILSINDDCTQLTITPETDYLTNIENGVSTACCTYLEITPNCCTPIPLCLRSNYVFDYSVVGCGTELVDAVSYDYFDIFFSGIDVSCVTQAEYTSFITVENTVETNPTDLTFRLYFSRGTTTLPFTFLLRTCEDFCLEYQIDGLITITDVNDHCNNFSDSGPTVTIPELPTGVTIDGANILVDTGAVGQAGTQFQSGVYCVSLVQNNIPESNSIFIDCGVECKVVDKVVEDPCSNLYALFKALQFADTCATLTCQQKCDLWYYIGSELDYFDNNPCEEDTSDCGCNS